ncbi:hypothetical protein QBC44DRAFT_92210 [Cladorrhinum sp. PSN332]|nr:hypothetical protein QBC44DRAFT_92210 [Cladorrhinum sp. PSN332]
MRLLPRPPRLHLKSTPLSRKYTTESTPFNPQSYLSSALQKFRATPPRRIPATLTPDPSVRLSQALDPTRTRSTPPPPSTLPQGHHMVYFEPLLSQEERMPDGTNVSHWPGGPFVRRMWAGGSVTFRNDHPHAEPELDGKSGMVCVERIKSEKDEDVRLQINESDPEKDKVFVDLERDYLLLDGSRKVIIEEKRKLVFMRERRKPSSTQQTTPAPVKEVIAPWKPDVRYALHPTRDLLKTFSDLTNNAHLIHLDREYAQKQEGYRDVLVQGPLTLVLMLEALSKQGIVREIEYRNLSPLFVNEKFEVCLKRKDAESGAKKEQNWIVWIEGPGGRLAVKGRGVTCV